MKFYSRNLSANIANVYMRTAYVGESLFAICPQIKAKLLYAVRCICRFQFAACPQIKATFMNFYLQNLSANIFCHYRSFYFHVGIDFQCMLHMCLLFLLGAICPYRSINPYNNEAWHQLVAGAATTRCQCRQAEAGQEIGSCLYFVVGRRGTAGTTRGTHAHTGHDQKSAELAPHCGEGRWPFAFLACSF